MKLVMTVVARDEGGIIEAWLAFHLNAGVDFVIAPDHGSTDGTTEILKRYEREGFVHLTRESGDFRQIEWATRMARLAASEFRADWVINSDADEFWWPRGGSLDEVLTYVPSRFGSVRGMWRHFVPRPDGVAPFAERMTIRLCEPNPQLRTLQSAFQDRALRAPRGECGRRKPRGVRRSRAPRPRVVPDRRAAIPHPVARAVRASIPPAVGERDACRVYARTATGRRVRGPSGEPHERVLRERAGRRGGAWPRPATGDTRSIPACETRRQLDVGGDPWGSSGRPVVRSGQLDFSNSEVDEAYVSELSLLGEVAELVRLQQSIASLEARVAAVERPLRRFDLRR